MKRLLPLLLLLLLMGQDCEPPLPEGGYCAATDDAFNIVLNAQATYSTIIGGTPSVNRRSTMFHYMPGKGSCTAVVLGPRVAMSAAHCRNTTENGRHLLQINRGDSAYWEASSVLEHPDYTEYRRNPADREARKADLLLLYFEDGPELPMAPPEDQVLGFYKATPLNVSLCESVTVQGFGVTEDDPAHPCPTLASDATQPIDALVGAKCLREGPYTITREDEKQLYSKHAVLEPVATCFGDSGGPMYIKRKGQPGLELAGITSTTFSQECDYASMHTKVAYFEPWVLANFGGAGVAGSL